MISNFSWVDEFVSGSAKPRKENKSQLIRDKIDKIISLTLSPPNIIDEKYKVLHLPVYTTPDENTVKQYLDLLRDAIKNNERVLVHCQFGQERTGIMLMIYLVEIKGMEPRAALSRLRTLRPSSLKTRIAVTYINNRYKI